MGASKRSIQGKFDSMNRAVVLVRQDRCAKVRNRNVECLKCAEACTSGCISVVEGELSIDASKCVGCGTCATVCPTCALEARMPCDAELVAACQTVAADCACVIACEPVLRIARGLVDEGRVARVACAGRVDESLVAQLAAAGIEDVVVACGPCEACAQRHGSATAHLVADTANDLLSAFGSAARVSVREGLPRQVFASDADAAAFAEKLQALREAGCACEPIEAAGHKGVGAETVEAEANEATSHGDKACRAQEGDVAAASAEAASALSAKPVLPHVMRDGTLPHFLPERRERLLDALSEMGQPQRPLNNRLWGAVVIDGRRCSSCRMCATFCPTGAIRKFDNDDGTFGVLHFPGDCVKCGSCRDICPEQAILLLDEVKPNYLLGGEVHRYTMKPRDVKIDDPHQILNTMKNLIPGNLYER